MRLQSVRTSFILRPSYRVHTGPVPRPASSHERALSDRETLEYTAHRKLCTTRRGPHRLGRFLGGQCLYDGRDPADREDVHTDDCPR